LFQFAFADTCSTITSGAMIGRTSFVGDLIYSVAVSGFIYPIIGHWVWGPDGFLATMGSAGKFLPSLGIGLPRLRRLDRRTHDRRLSSRSRVLSRWVRGSAGNSSAMAAGQCCLMI
jgi:hypothetical protein